MRVFSLDSESAISRLRAAIQKLRIAHPEITDVRLVGSLARGEASPGSDADLLVLLDHSELPFNDRIGPLLRDLDSVGMGVEILPFTREEFERRLADGDPFVRRLAAEARPLDPVEVSDPSSRNRAR